MKIHIICGVEIDHCAWSDAASDFIVEQRFNGITIDTGIIAIHDDVG